MLGAVHKLRRQAWRREGLPNVYVYYINLCSKLVYRGGGGQKSSKSCLRRLCMAPYKKNNNSVEKHFGIIISNRVFRQFM